MRGGNVNIQLADHEGKPPVLGLTHEKVMHLIVVSNDLSEFYHLHPNQISENNYAATISLPSSSYTAFVDIKPEGKDYLITPINLNLGLDLPRQQASLKKDVDLKKEISGKIVELTVNPLKVDEIITLTFNIINASPSPYLGALGHVVIIDQDVNQFIHVHPVSDHETVFQTEFEKPGLYKVWAEFKFEDKVFAFPYVIEVK
jgi:hypothetical protein